MSAGRTSIASHVVTAGLLAAGAAACATLGPMVSQEPDLKAPLNPFGINTSPYGEVIAMAMQAPVDVYWNQAAETKTAQAPTLPASAGPRDRLRHFIEEIETASVERTNPNHTGKALSFYLRREIEKKLRFAYELDPGHYGNYNSYHFFLTEPAVGTRRELNSEALSLAGRTVRYALSKRDDPRLPLTAAAAAENVLLLMFNDRHNPTPRFTTAQMREQLAILDHSLARHDEISAEWEKTGNWSLLSPQRVAEYADRLTFVAKMRDVIVKTIERLEAEDASAPAAPAPSAPPKLPGF